MFIVTLKYRDKARADPLVKAHRAWVNRGFADGVFLLIAPILPEAGGVIIAKAGARTDLEQRILADPMVAAGVLDVDIMETGHGRAIDALTFLIG